MRYLIDVDKLGRLRARIAKLESDAEKIEASIKKRGPGVYHGRLFRATVSRFKRGYLDLKAVRKRLSARWINNHTRFISIEQVTMCAR